MESPRSNHRTDPSRTDSPTLYSGVARQYARCRPSYPRALFAYLAMLCPRTAMAWDCATGNGQAAHALADHFDAVIATDASAKQLNEATWHPRVHYAVAPAERSGLGAQSVDLITVAQAAHWFELPAFYAEAHRVLRPGGVLAVWTYHLPSVNERVDAVLRRYFYDVLADHVPAELVHVNSEYRTLPFPRDELPAPSLEGTTVGALEDMLGFLNSFSARVVFERAEGYNPVDRVQSELQMAWGAPEARLEWRWRFSMRIARWGPAMLTASASP